jgi:multidrug efflux pump subunit AcrA (membrane-fusion protein)
LVWAGALLCLAGAATGVAVGVAGAGGTTYRMSDATTTSVQSLLTLNGKAEPVGKVTADFGASGIVETVNVTLGQLVTAGQTLATLTPTSLQQAATAAQTNVNAAEAKLTADEDAETAAGTSSASPSSNGSDGSGTATTVSKAQATVVADEQTLGTDQQTATSDLATSQSACGGSSSAGSTSTPGSTSTTGKFTSGLTHTGSGTTTSGSPPTRTKTGGESGQATTSQSSAGTGTKTKSDGTGTKTKSTANSSASATTASCSADLATTLTAEQQVASDDKTLTGAEGTLAQLLSAESTAASTSSRSANRGSGDSAGAGTASTSGSITPAQLADDQAAIDNDRVSLIKAQQALAAADLVSPISGTVVSLGIAAGQSVTAGSSSDAITVVSTDSFEATATLTASQSAQVKVGDAASVSVVGSADPLMGNVTRVGPVDVSGGNTYPVLVSLPVGSHGIFSGSSAQISVVLQQAHDVLAVPTSSVHTLRSGDSFVDVRRAGQESTVPVKVGVVGGLFTQILSGIHKGEAVVLADLTTPVPTSNNTSPFGGVSALTGTTPTFHFSVAGGPRGAGGAVQFSPRG